MDPHSLTIVSVVYQDPFFCERNVALTASLNPGHAHRWIIVDNSESPVFRKVDMPRVSLVRGVARPQARDMGSLHHAMALERGLRLAETRFVLLLDHDFYILMRDWMDRLLAWMQRRQLALFGSVWHPRWFYQYRAFPTVHCMLIDTAKLPPAELKLHPLINDDRWWQIVNNEKCPMPRVLRNTLKAQRIRDTGWQVYDACRRDASIQYETLTPHYVRPAHGRARWETRLSRVLPQMWRQYPAENDGYTPHSFLKTRLPAAYALGWEEFFWVAEPFGFHLRRVGRSMAGESTTDDHGQLQTLLESFVADRD